MAHISRCHKSFFFSFKCCKVLFQVRDIVSTNTVEVFGQLKLFFSVSDSRLAELKFGSVHVGTFSSIANNGNGSLSVGIEFVGVNFSDNLEDRANAVEHFGLVYRGRLSLETVVLTERVNLVSSTMKIRNKSLPFSERLSRELFSRDFHVSESVVANKNVLKIGDSF